METYNVIEAGRIIGLSKAQIQRFVKAELLEPWVEAGGKGFYRSFNERNLAELALIKAMFEHGLTTQPIKKAMTTLTDYDQRRTLAGDVPVLHPNSPAKSNTEWFLVCNDGIDWELKPKELGSDTVGIRKSTTVSVIFNLTRISQHTAQNIEKDSE